LKIKFIIFIFDGKKLKLQVKSTLQEQGK